MESCDLYLVPIYLQIGKFLWVRQHPAPPGLYATDKGVSSPPTPSILSSHAHALHNEFMIMQAVFKSFSKKQMQLAAIIVRIMQCQLLGYSTSNANLTEILSSIGKL